MYVEARVIEVYTQPSGPGALPAYGQRNDYTVGAAVPVVVAGTTSATPDTPLPIN